MAKLIECTWKQLEFENNQWECPFNGAINIDIVEEILKSPAHLINDKGEIYSCHCIVFEFPETHRKWHFHNEDDRNVEYQKIVRDNE